MWLQSSGETCLSRLGSGSRPLPAQVLCGFVHVRGVPVHDRGDDWRACPGTEAHPRVGGGAPADAPALVGSAGPSPRGRGSHHRRMARRHVPGSIPAWAGEPDGNSPSRTWRRVHPRVGGGANSKSFGFSPVYGPSPRGRGSLAHHVPQDGLDRSIPAWAGEPSPSWRLRCSTRVHPRVGGGADECQDAGIPFHGPSPRGRGSLAAAATRASNARSIPAWAGEPCRPASERRRARVHPRVGGGADLRRTGL